MTRCLVTGGLGFIGSHVVDVLIENGNQVIVVDDLSTGCVNNENHKAEYEIFSVLDSERMLRLFRSFRPEWVFHLAALPRIQPSYEDPKSHDDANVRPVFSLFDSIIRFPVKAFVFSSSSSVYGNPTEIPTREESPVAPLSPYAIQKLTAEQYVHILGKHLDIPVVSLRYFNPFGPRSFNNRNRHNAYSSVVGIFANAMLNRQPLQITGDGNQKRDFIYVRDVAEANVLVAQQIAQSRDQIFNVGSGNTVSIIELAQMFNSKYEFLPAREGEAKVTHADITKLKHLGWRPKTLITNYIKEILDETR